jgi:hypothetical protein
MSCGERTGAVFHYLTASRSVGKAKRGSRDTGKIVSSREVRALLQGSLLYLDLTGTRNGRSFDSWATSRPELPVPNGICTFERRRFLFNPKRVITVIVLLSAAHIIYSRY